MKTRIILILVSLVVTGAGCRIKSVRALLKLSNNLFLNDGV